MVEFFFFSSPSSRMLPGTKVMEVGGASAPLPPRGRRAGRAPPPPPPPLMAPCTACEPAILAAAAVAAVDAPAAPFLATVPPPMRATAAARSACTFFSSLRQRYPRHTAWMRSTAMEGPTTAFSTVTHRRASSTELASSCMVRPVTTRSSNRLPSRLVGK